MIIIDKDTFPVEVEQSDIPVVVDFWGPQCGPCLALMPEVDVLSKEFEGKVKFGKINVTENRRLCIQLKVMALPTFLFYKGGECISRLSKEDTSIESIRMNTAALL